MKVLLVVVLVALTGATAARADTAVPAGFTLNPTFSKAASFVAGKPVVDYCAASAAIFESAATAATGFDNPAGAGFSRTGARASYLHPLICSWLKQWNAGKRVDLDHVAAALLTVGHEAELLSGVSDESIADCKALARLPQMIARFFPLRHRTTLHVIMGDAWDAHDNQPEQYLTNCPTR